MPLPAPRTLHWSWALGLEEKQGRVKGEWKGQPHPGRRLVGTLAGARAGVEHIVLEQHGDGAQDEGQEEVQVDGVAGAAQPPVGREVMGWARTAGALFTAPNPLSLRHIWGIPAFV